MMKYMALLLFCLSLQVQAQQDNKEVYQFLLSSIDTYNEAKYLDLQIDVLVLQNGIIDKASSFQCASIISGDNRRTSIRNTDIFEVDSFRLLLNHDNAYAQLQSRSLETSEKSFDEMQWLDEMKANLEDFITQSQLENTPTHYIFTSIADPTTESTAYWFNKVSKLLDKVVVRYDNEHLPYDEIMMQYKTKLSNTAKQSDCGLSEYLEVTLSIIALKGKYAHYELYKQLKQ